MVDVYTTATNISIEYAYMLTLIDTPNIPSDNTTAVNGLRLSNGFECRHCPCLDSSPHSLISHTFSTLLRLIFPSLHPTPRHTAHFKGHPKSKAPT